MESTQRNTAAPSNEPDAELLRLNAEYRALMGEIDAGKYLNAEGEIFKEATDRRNDLERKIADTPAATYAGIGIKLLIAVDNFPPLGPGETRTTDELNLESALADAERLAGDVSITEDHTCTIEELAALKFKPIDGGAVPMQSLDEWLERAKQEYMTMTLVLPIIESSDADFEQRIRSHENPQALCEELQRLTENVEAWQEHHRCALETLDCAWTRLMAVLARFVDGDDAKAGGSS